MSPSPFKVVKAIPRRTIALAAIFTLLVMVAAFVMGRESVELEESGALSKLRQLQKSYSELRSERDELLKQQAIFDSARKVDQASVLESQRLLAELQSELDGAKRQLAFYQRIVSPEDQVKGLYIENLELVKSSEDSAYDYHLTLAQLQRKQPFVKGTVDLLWVDGKGKAHSFFTAAKPKQKLESFGFRYFQLMQGSVVLPKGASPVAIEVRIKPSTKGRKSISNRWNWSEVVSR